MKYCETLSYSIFKELKEIIFNSTIPIYKNINISEIVEQHLFDIIFKFLNYDIKLPNLKYEQAKSFAGPFIQKKLASVANMKCSMRSSESSIALFTFSQTHTEILIPILKNLESSDFYFNVFRSAIGYNIPKKEILMVKKKCKNNLIFMDQFITINSFLQYIDYKNKNKLKIKKFFRENEYNLEKVANNILNFSQIKHILLWYFLVQLPNAIRHLIYTKEIINLKPTMLVLGNDFCSRSRSIIFNGRLKNIPSIVIQHGTIAYPKYYLPYADYMSIWGKRDYEILKNEGVDNKKLIITGSPKYQEKKFLSVHHIKNQVNVIFATTPEITKDHAKSVIQMLLNGLERLNGYQLIVKPHPLENYKNYEALLPKHKSLRIYNSTENIDKLINKCFLGIVFCSTVVLNFCLKGIPLASVIPENTIDPTGMTNYSLIYKINTIEDFTNYIYKIKNSEKFWEGYYKQLNCLISDYLGNPLGKANKNIMRLIEKVNI